MSAPFEVITPIPDATPILSEIGNIAAEPTQDTTIEAEVTLSSLGLMHSIQTNINFNGQ
jgi:hypothetical protein